MGSTDWKYPKPYITIIYCIWAFIATFAFFFSFFCWYFLHLLPFTILMLTFNPLLIYAFNGYALNVMEQRKLLIVLINSFEFVSPSPISRNESFCTSYTFVGVYHILGCSWMASIIWIILNSFLLQYYKIRVATITFKTELRCLHLDYEFFFVLLFFSICSNSFFCFYFCDCKSFFITRIYHILCLLLTYVNEMHFLTIVKSVGFNWQRLLSFNLLWLQYLKFLNCPIE